MAATVQNSKEPERSHDDNPTQLLLQRYCGSIPERNRHKLNKRLDFEHDGVQKHLGEIAGSMDEWEGRVAEELMLTKVEIASIKTDYPLKLNLQTRAALSKWQEKFGFNATYLNLMKAFLKAEKTSFAEAVCKVLTNTSSDSGLRRMLSDCSSVSDQRSSMEESLTSNSLRLSSFGESSVETGMEQAELAELFGLLKGLADRWYQLGVQLNIEVSELNEIESNDDDVKRQLFELLKSWLQRTDSNRSERRPSLLEALNTIGDNVLSRDIGSSDYSSLSSEPNELRLSEESELTDVLKNVSDWYALGIQLDFETGELNEIEKDNPESVRNRLSVFVQKWLEKTKQCRRQRRDSLMKALNKMDENVLAESVRLSDCSFLSDEPQYSRINSRKLSSMGGSSTDDDVFLPLLKDEDVASAIEELDSKFSDIEVKMRTDLDTKVKVQTFVTKIRVLPLPIKHEYEHIKEDAKEMKKLDDTDKVMDRLNDHWNFVDYHLLEHVVKKFGNEDLRKEMTKFTDKLKAFRKNISVRQFAKCWTGRKSIPKDYRKINVEIDVDPDYWSLEQLERARVEMCTRLDKSKPHPHPSLFAILVSEVKPGSVIIVFAVSVGWLAAFICCQKGNGILSNVKIQGIKISDLQLDVKTFLTVCCQVDPDVELLRCLLEGGYEPDREVNEKGQTPLMVISKKGRLDLVELLLDYNADVNLHSTNNVTPLGYASYEGHTDIVELLLEKGADVNALNQVGRTALSNASSPGHVETVRVLLKHGAATEIDLKNQRGATPLHYAAQGGHLGVIELLLEHGADIEETNQPGGTALSIAIAAGHINVVKLLLSHGASVNATTGDNEQTPLMFASLIGDMEMVRLILKYHPVINARSKNDITALMLATQGCHDDVVDTLLKEGADPNLAEKETGWAPLHVAVKHSHSYISKLLLEHEAEPEANGVSAFDIMRVLSRDHEAVSEAFEELGIKEEKGNKISEASTNKLRIQDQLLLKVFTQHATELHVQDEQKNRFLYPEFDYVSLEEGQQQTTTSIDKEPVNFQEEFKDSTITPTRTKDYTHSGIFGFIEKLVINGEKCVGRKYRNDLLDYQDQRRLRSSIKRLECLSHKNIAKMNGVCFYDDLKYPVIVTETFDTTLDKKDLKETSLDLRMSVLNKVAHGLAYLHNQRITHYSLTPQNVRVSESLEIVKIGGVEDGQIVDHQKLLTHNQDTPSIAVYMPPEVSKPEFIYTQFDIFSFGHLAMCFMIVEFSTILLPTEHVAGQEHHVTGMTELERRQGYVSRMDKELESDYRNVSDLIKRCLFDKPQKRPKAQELKEISPKLQRQEGVDEN